MPEQKCEFPRENATTEEIRRALHAAKIIAVVGLSGDASKDSHRVASYLQKAGYHIIPVNPKSDSILGQKSYASLDEIPDKVDIVDVFRKPEFIPGIVEAAIRIGAKVIWMQEGLAHNASADTARKAGVTVVMNKCIMKEHRKIS